MAIPWRLRCVLVLGAFACILVVAAPARALDGPQLTRSLDRAMDSARAANLGAQVTDMASGATLYARNAASRRIPASVEKLFTTAAALQRSGPDARLLTRVARTGTVSAGTLDGDLVLIGGGDPSLDRAAIKRMARAVRRAGIRRVSGSVLGDESLFDDTRGGPRTGGLYDRDVGGVLGALTVGRGFSARPGGPALAAARALARALRADGVVVLGRTATGKAPEAARTIAQSRSAPLSELVRRTNQRSDNFYAEVLLKGLGALNSGLGTTAAGATAASGLLAPLGVAPAIADGSGLARANRVSAADVVALLRTMRATPGAAAFEASLAVAGQSGTLRRRLRFTNAAGACRGKTGTLSRVSTLAGICVTRSGRTLAFAFLMNDLALWRGHAAQDRALRALVALR